MNLNGNIDCYNRISNEEKQQQQQCHRVEKQRKNKSRGNRKLQRFRTKLRKQGFDVETIATLINNYNNNNPNQCDTKEEESTIADIDVESWMISLQDKESKGNNDVFQERRPSKRKRETTSSANITTSISQMSISNLPKKRHRSTTMNNNIKEDTHVNKSISNNTPKYLQVPDSIFKQMLSKTLTGTESIIQLLFDTPEKLQYIRTYAHLLNNICYLKLEQDYWEHYDKIVTTTIEDIWSSTVVEKELIKQNNLYRINFKTKIQLEKHRQFIFNQLQKAENELNKHKQQQLMNNLFDTNQLSTIILAFVRQGQYKLVKDFERKKQILQFDVNDHRFIKTFYNLKPMEHQINSAKIIWQATKEKLQAEEELTILKQRIYTKQLPSSFHILDHSIDNIEQMLQQPVLNENKRATLLSCRLKTIAQFKYDMMVLAIKTAQETVRGHTKIIMNEKQKLIDSVRGQTPLPKSLVQLMNIITARQTNMVQRSQITLKHKLSFFDDAPTTENNMTDDISSHILPSSAIIEVTSYLSSKQLSYLTRGLKYVPPCQNRLSHQSIDKIIIQEHQNIVQCFKNGFNKYQISSSDQRAQDFFISIENLLRRLYTTPLSPKLQIRTEHEHHMIRSIQYQLKRSNIIIRPTDKSKVFHLGSMEDYHRKALEYMQKTNAYQEISSGINPYLDHLRAVLALIDPLLKNKAINLQLWKRKMRPDPKTIELAHLYFIPKPHKINTPLRPIVSSIHAAATGVSHFLDQILRPLYYRVAQLSTFINDIDFVRQLQEYQDNGYLLSTTLFLTFDVTDLYTMIPREGTLAALSRFLIKYSTKGKINDMTIDTIMKMARIVLNTNCFAFENKYYQQIRGGAMGSPLTMTLANIYMLEWEQPLIKHQKLHKEVYGRYIDDVFMTTNSLNELNILLNRIEKNDENIRITRSFGSTIEFLDVLVNNDHGQVKTSVFHKPAAEPYLLPYLSEHPRHVHRNTIKGALFRAIRLCSHVEDFDHERLNIELKLLLNGYPLKFITYEFKQFFEQYNACILISEQQSNDLIYQGLHKKLLAQLSRRERLNKELISNDNHILQEQQQQQNKSKITVHFTFETGPMLQFKRELRHLWEKYYIYKGSRMNNVHLQIGTRSNKSLCQLLVKKKPPKNMLTDVTLRQTDRQTDNNNNNY